MNLSKFLLDIPRNDLPPDQDIEWIINYVSTRKANERIICNNEHYFVEHLKDNYFVITGVQRHCRFIIDTTRHNGNVTKELVFDIFVNSEYRRTFVNQVQINEFCKQIWNRDRFAIVEIVPVERDYVEG